MLQDISLNIIVSYVGKFKKNGNFNFGKIVKRKCMCKFANQSEFILEK